MTNAAGPVQIKTGAGLDGDTLTRNEFTNTQYTWPSAGITVIGTTEVDTTTGGVTIHSLTWEIDPGSFVVWEWQITS